MPSDPPTDPTPTRPSNPAALDRLVEALRAMPSREGLMNPYRSARAPDVSAVAEEIGRDADRVRTANLRAYLDAVLGAGADTLLCGEAPSCVGTRWTGIPFTSERETASGDFPLEACHLLRRAARGERPLMKEASALYVWRALARAPVPVVLWNALQLHPHPPGDPRANRTPADAEVELGRESLERLIELVRPRRIVALGRTAERALKRMGHDAVYVRHPAHGGSTRMMRGLEALGVIGGRTDTDAGAGRESAR